MYRPRLLSVVLLFSGLIWIIPIAPAQTVDSGFVSGNDACQLIDGYLSKLAAEKSYTGGLLIVHNGLKVFSKAYGMADREKKIPFTPATCASMGSITKAFTAACILQLAEQGKLSVTDRLSRFFPDVPSDKADITIHQLLTHSSGFREFLAGDAGDYEKLEKPEFLRRAFAETLAFRPGEKAVYTNVGMSMLAAVIEQVSGMDYEAYLKKNLLEPAGIRGIGYHYPETPGEVIAVGYQNGLRWGTLGEHFEKAGGGPYWNLKGNGGLEASLNDMFLWINAISNHSILSDTTVIKMFTPHIAEEGYDGQSFFGYGCNIAKTRRNTRLIDNGGSNGIYFARMLRLPDEGLIFYMVTSESSVNTNKVLPNVTQLWFTGKITQDALSAPPRFENMLSPKIYEILQQPSVTDLGDELKKENIVVGDDMVLLEVGQKLTEEAKTDQAIVLYKYYTATFPNIVVAWNDLGEIYLAKGRKEEARKCFEQALKIRPGNPRATENLKKISP